MPDEVAPDLRRLPVYLLLDCSGSMAGEPIAALQMGIKTLVVDLQNDPYALETVWLSVIAFGGTVEQVAPLTDINEFAPPELEAFGTTPLGEAMNLLGECLATEVRTTTAEQKGDWKPMVFLFTDGDPTDAWESPLEEFHRRGRANLIVCGAGPEVNDATLLRLGPTIIRLEDTQPGTLGAFMNWVSASVTAASKSLGTGVSLGSVLPKFEPEPRVISSPSPDSAA